MAVRTELAVAMEPLLRASSAVAAVDAYARGQEAAGRL